MSPIELRAGVGGHLARTAYTAYGHPMKRIAQRYNNSRIREFVRTHPEVTMFGSHDRGEFARLSTG